MTLVVVVLRNSEWPGVVQQLFTCSKQLLTTSAQPATLLQHISSG
jgi:hypothetical protein